MEPAYKLTLVYVPVPMVSNFHQVPSKAKGAQPRMRRSHFHPPLICFSGQTAGFMCSFLLIGFIAGCRDLMQGFFLRGGGVYL